MADIVELITPCSRENCVRLVRSALDREHRAVRGNITRSGFIARKKISYRNSFQPRLVAEFFPQNDKTLIRCAFSRHWFVRAFTAVWFGFLILFASIMAILTCISGVDVVFYGEGIKQTALMVHMVMFAWSSVMCLFGCGVLLFGKFLARDERAYLLAFVQRTTGATTT